MSQGPHLSDTDLTMDAIDSTQSQSQDCEPTPPCPLDGSKTNLFDTADFREAIATSSTPRTNNLPAGQDPVSPLGIKVLPTRNSNTIQGVGKNNPQRGSPHPRPRGFGDGLRSRSNTPDPLSPDSGGAVVGSPSSSRSVHSPGSHGRTPTTASSPLRRSSPGTPTTPRSPGFGKRRTDFGSPPSGEGRPHIGYPVYPDAVLASRQRHVQQQPPPGSYLLTYVPQHAAQGREAAPPRSISPQRKFASESELTRPAQGEHANPHFFRTGNHTSDNLHDLAGSPVRGVATGFSSHVTPQQQQPPSVHGYSLHRGTGHTPSPREGEWPNPTSPTSSSMSGRLPPAYGGWRNCGSTSPQPKRKFYVQAAHPSWSAASHSKEVNPVASGVASRIPARRPMSFVRALEVSDGMEMTSPSQRGVAHSPGGTPKAEHRLGLQQITSPSQQIQSGQEGDRRSFYDTNYEISV